MKHLILNHSYAFGLTVELADNGNYKFEVHGPAKIGHQTVVIYKDAEIYTLLFTAIGSSFPMYKLVFKYPG